jgi:hypothetical protein
LYWQGLLKDLLLGFERLVLGGHARKR